jgi:hypothetical protein
MLTKQQPVYLVHAQVVDREDAPTIRYAPVNYWWTDPVAMAEAFIDVRPRPIERREAAFYRPKMFRPLSDLAAHLTGDGLEGVQAQLMAQGWNIALYQRHKKADSELPVTGDGQDESSEASKDLRQGTERPPN